MHHYVLNTPQWFLKKLQYDDRTYRKPAAYVSERLLMPPAHAGPSPPSHTFLPGVCVFTTCINKNHAEINFVKTPFGFNL